MKKKGLYLLFLMMLSASFLVSCSKEDNNENNENEGIVPSLTGAITKTGIDFDNPKLECTKITITDATSTRAVETDANKYTSILLDFNDNLQVTIRSKAFSNYTKETDKVYFLFKNCFKSNNYDGDFTFNLLKDGKVEYSETFDPPTNANWWKMPDDDSYFTLNLDFKGKEMMYKGNIKYTFDK